MRAAKAFFIAFSLYSKIPVPQFEWNEEDMKYMLCFFPWVGAVIGALLYGMRLLYDKGYFGGICYTLAGCAVPLIVTGGFHADGFMDTADAFHSYREREEKLRILKDPHIGAFSVISFAVYGLVYAAAFSEISGKRLFAAVCLGFYLSRCLSGIGVVAFPSAKKEGMLNTFADSAEKKVVKWALYLQAFICMAVMVILSPWAIIIVLSALASFGYYYFKCSKELGGITGDTAGWFVLVCEEAIIVSAALINIIHGGV